MDICCGRQYWAWKYLTQRSGDVKVFPVGTGKARQDHEQHQAQKSSRQRSPEHGYEVWLQAHGFEVPDPCLEP